MWYFIGCFTHTGPLIHLITKQLFLNDDGFVSLLVVFFFFTDNTGLHVEEGVWGASWSCSCHNNWCTWECRNQPRYHCLPEASPSSGYGVEALLELYHGCLLVWFRYRSYFAIVIHFSILPHTSLIVKSSKWNICF